MNPSPALSLPVDALRENVITNLLQNPFVVLTAPTGSGKSTRVPVFLMDPRLPTGTIYVLQPRVLAARLLAERVADETGATLGLEVGYRTRHDSKYRHDSRIVFITQGLFVRLLQENPEMKGMAAVVLDEFHERSVHGDLVLGHLKQHLGPQCPTKAVVMSATLEAEILKSFLGAPILKSEGRTYPVTVRHLGLAEQQRDTPLWDHAVTGVKQVIAAGHDGDGLVFMPGRGEISRTIRALESASLGESITCHPLFGEMPLDAQRAALAPAKNRKIIVATNVAETSITVPGITWVVDGGYARVARYQSTRRLDTLVLERISQHSAEQRAGRSGRTAPGLCLRLWSEATHQRLALRQEPEIHRVDLADSFLQMARLYKGTADSFPWLDPPTPDALREARTLLRRLGAIDEKDRLTDMGVTMSDFPLHPRLSRMVLEAKGRNCPREALLWAALISEPDITLRNRWDPDTVPGRQSDLTTLGLALLEGAASRFSMGLCERLGLHAQASRRAFQTFQQFLNTMNRMEPEDAADTDDEGMEPAVSQAFDLEGKEPDLARCLLLSFPDQLAVKEQAGSLAASLSGGRRGQVAESSRIRQATLFIPAEITEIISGKDRRTLLALNTALTVDDLEAVHPEMLQNENGVVWNTVDRQVDGEKRILFGDLAVFRKRSDEVPVESAAMKLAEVCLSGQFVLPGWNDAVERWITRVRWCAFHFPDRRLSTYTEEDRHIILAEIFAGARSVRQVKDRECFQTVKFALSWDDQQFVEQMAPEQLTLSNGQSLRLVYEANGTVTGSLKLQKLYDVSSHPCVGGGQVRVLVDILAPNQRTAQKTLDLPGFWTGSYPEVRKQLMGRYPKHEWR